MYSTCTLNPIYKIKGNVQLPGSKSISNRVLLLSAISEGTTYIKNLLYSDDTIYMLNALYQLGIKYHCTSKTNYIIQGCKNIFQYKSGISLFLGNAGTAVRPLTAVLSLQKKNYHYWR